MDKEIRNKIANLVEDVGLPPYLYTDPDRFIAGATPVLYSGMFWDKEEIINGVEAFLSGSWIASGENVKKFEKQFANKIRDRYGVMVNSGSSANLILVTSMKEYRSWKDGSEIIVSPVGFPTTIAPISQNNLKPVFIDIEMDTLNFNVDLVEEKITDKTVAIFLSPVLGNPLDMDRVVEICNHHKIDLILDSCDSLGSKWREKYLTEYAIASSHSLYASHTLSTGEGGLITTSNPDIARIARQLIAWGRDCWCSSTQAMSKNGACGKRFDKWLKNYDGIVDHKYFFRLRGYNLKPLDMQGAIGLAQIKKIDEIFERRINSKNILDKLFSKYIDGVRMPQPLENSKPVWFGTPIVCETKELKNELVQHLENNLIQTRNYFAGNLLLHPGYEHLDDWKKYPNANKVLDLVFFVGSAPFYTEKHFQYFEKVLKEFKNE